MKMKMMWVAIAFMAIATTARALDVPELKGPVNDNAGVLTADQVHELDTMLRANEAATSNQIIFLSITSLENEPMEEYAHRVLRTWKLGDKKRNNGVLFLVVVKEDHRRIETGYGAEGALPDGKAGEILRDYRPLFKEKKYYEGSKGVLSGTVLALKGEYVGDGSVGGRKASGSSHEQTHAVTLLQVVGVFAFLIIALLSGGVGKATHWFIGGLVCGTITAIGSYLIVGALLLAFFAFVFGFVIAAFLSCIDLADLGSGSSSSSDGGFWSSSSSDSGGGGYDGGGGDGGGGGASD